MLAFEQVTVGVDHLFDWLKLLLSANRIARHYSSSHNFCNFPASLPTGSILNRTRVYIMKIEGEKTYPFSGFSFITFLSTRPW